MDQVTKSVPEVPAGGRMWDNNHWIAASAPVSLDSAVLALRQDQRNRTGLIRLNDVSLPFGRLFADSRFFKETDGRYAPTGTCYVDQNDKHMFPEKLNEQDFLCLAIVIAF
jgi:hypothetical protein